MRFVIERRLAESLDPRMIRAFHRKGSFTTTTFQKANWDGLAETSLKKGNEGVLGRRVRRLPGREDERQKGRASACKVER